MSESVNVKEVSTRLGISWQIIERNMRHDAEHGTRRVPFGIALEGENRWRYVIPRERFEAYMSGRDMRPQIA